jgi:tRNA-dihydrouridine synthase B
MPLIANGDITTPEKAQYVLKYTGADAVMIGRAAQGRPWIFREIDHYLKTGTYLTRPTNEEIHETTIEHVKDLYDFYGENKGLRIARKHISWYTKGLKNSAYFRAAMNKIEDNNEQIDYIHLFFEDLSKKNKYIAYEDQSNDKELAVR